jgi:DNA-binding transcriptional ArsR family regulator
MVSIQKTCLALASDTRRRILEKLTAGEMRLGEIAHDEPMSRPAVSQHVKVLLDMGVVSTRREGQHQYYRLEPRAFAALRAWLERLDRSSSVRR